MQDPGFLAGLIGWAIGWTMSGILHRIKIVYCFRERLERLQGFYPSISPSTIGMEKWLEKRHFKRASDIAKNGPNVPWFNVIKRYQMSKSIPELILNIQSASSLLRFESMVKKLSHEPTATSSPQPPPPPKCEPPPPPPKCEPPLPPLALASPPVFGPPSPPQPPPKCEPPPPPLALASPPVFGPPSPPQPPPKCEPPPPPLALASPPAPPVFGALSQPPPAFSPSLPPPPPPFAPPSAHPVFGPPSPPPKPPVFGPPSQPPPEFSAPLPPPVFRPPSSPPAFLPLPPTEEETPSQGLLAEEVDSTDHNDLDFSSKKNSKSLKRLLRTINPTMEMAEKVLLRRDNTDSAVGWYERLRELLEEAKNLIGQMDKIHSFDIFRQYRYGKRILILTSRINDHLRLFPFLEMMPASSNDPRESYFHLFSNNPSGS